MKETRLKLNDKTAYQASGDTFTFNGVIVRPNLVKTISQDYHVNDQDNGRIL